jgi:hypothetical protein
MVLRQPSPSLPFHNTFTDTTAVMSTTASTTNREGEGERFSIELRREDGEPLAVRPQR